MKFYRRKSSLRSEVKQQKNDFKDNQRDKLLISKQKYFSVFLGPFEEIFLLPQIF